MKKLLSIYILCLAFVSQAFCENAIPNNEIWYSSSDGEVVAIPLNAFYTRIVSNTYENGRGRIVFNGNVTSIGKQAFMYAESLTSITIPNCVTSIEDYAFMYCSGLTSINFPSSLTSIGAKAFDSCIGLTSITIPNSVTSIGDYAFYNCQGLTSIDISNRLTSIGNSTFSSCSGLTSIAIPKSVTSIGTGAFSWCTGLTSIAIPNSVTSIGDYAFYGCQGLISIDIPNSVSNIGDRSFEVCSSLTDMYVHWNEPLEILSNGIFIYADITEATLHVPYGTKALYESADVWRYFGKIVDDTSALNSIAVCEEETPVFNLVGMRQYPSCQTPGVYVLRGKKMIVR